MKKSILTLMAISALFIAGCDSVTKYSKTASYRIQTAVDKEVSDDFCETRRGKGVILIKNSSIAGEVQNRESNTILYLNGELDDDTKDVTLEIREGDEVIGIVEGHLGATEGYGTWASNRCYGKWQAIRED